eukprot:6602302-Pyramimonas_sp.AAC.1
MSLPHFVILTLMPAVVATRCNARSSCLGLVIISMDFGEAFRPVSNVPCTKALAACFVCSKTS